MGRWESAEHTIAQTKGDELEKAHGGGERLCSSGRCSVSWGKQGLSSQHQLREEKPNGAVQTTINELKLKKKKENIRFASFNGSVMQYLRSLIVSPPIW